MARLLNDESFRQLCKKYRKYEVNLFGVGEGSGKEQKAKGKGQRAKGKKARGEKERKGKAASVLGVIYGVRYFCLPDGIRPPYEGEYVTSRNMGTKKSQIFPDRKIWDI